MLVSVNGGLGGIVDGIFGWAQSSLVSTSCEVHVGEAYLWDSQGKYAGIVVLLVLWFACCLQL